MLATLTALFHAELAPQTPEDLIRRDWQRLLDAATTAQERDEINDLFGDAVAA
jgi:hypothetical protein